MRQKVPQKLKPANDKKFVKVQVVPSVYVYLSHPEDPHTTLAVSSVRDNYLNSRLREGWEIIQIVEHRGRITSGGKSRAATGLAFVLGKRASTEVEGQ